MTLYSSSLSNSAQLLVIAFLEKEGHDFYSIVFCDAGGGDPPQLQMSTCVQDPS